jgi:hypothetical protein
MPEMKDRYNSGLLITQIEDEERRNRHLPNPARLVVKRKTLWHRTQTQRTIDKFFAQTDCRVAIILCDEFDDPPADP